MSKIQHLLTLVALFVATGVWAQTDVTADYLLNSDFSEDSPVEVGICTYGRDMASNGTSDYSLLSVNGWDILSAGVTDGDYENNAVAGGTFAISSSAWLGGNTFTAPAINSEGNAEGTALGIVAVWGATAQYAQDVMLEAGTYVLKVNYINTAGTGSFSKNLCGFIEADGTEHLFPTKSYAVGKWNTEIITFELAETTTGTISLGYTAANAGSASMPHLFIQNVQLLYYDGDVPPEIDIPVVVLDRIFDDGTYYLQNLTTGKFFCAGGSWGTHAMVGDYGLDLNLAMLADGTYTIDTQISNGGEQHYLSGEWLDGNATPITIMAVAGMQGAYSLHNGQGYLAAGRDNVVSLTSSMNDTGAQWKFITKDDYFAALQEQMANATQDSPVDVTAYIKAPNFNRNDLRNNYWIKSNNSGNVIIGGPSGNYANYGCEFWNNTFNIYQTIQGLPDGYYSFNISGFGTNGTTKIYANEVEKPFAATESLVNQFQAALENIANETYAVSSTGPVEAIDGELTIGVKRETLEAADWTVIDNARLYYYGTEVEIIEEPQTTGSIAGYVMVDGGNVPAGTTVTITNEEFETSYTATVNANGYFTVADLKPGFYEVSVTCAGYIAVTSFVMVNEGETVEQTISLVKEPEVVVGERQKPEIANFVVTTPFVVDHNYYLYNVSQAKYLSQGEAWGSQSCVVDFENDASGNKPFVYQIKKTGAGNTLPDGQYFLQSKNGKNQGWLFRVNTDGRSGSTSTCYSDGADSKASAANSTAAWVITQDDNGILQITLPTEDAMYIADCALGVDPEHYSNAAQPTYAVYWDILIGEKTQWMLFDAEAYDAANEIYSVAAPTLLELIGQAQERNIDVTEAQAVYNNVNATLAQINEQIDILKEQLAVFATAKAPADVTDKYIVNPTPTSNADGWDTPQGRPNAFDTGNNNAEFWNLSGYNLQQTIQKLPAGLYKLTAIALCREGHHGYLYAGTDSVELAHVSNSVVNNRTQAGAWFDEGNGVNEIMFYHPAEGPLTIGIVTDNTTGDHWTVWRSFSLGYLGNDLEASYKDAIRMTVPEDWADEFAEAIYVPTYFTAVEEAIASVDNIATVDEAIAALQNPAPAAALKALRDNVAAWTTYSEWYAAFENKFFNVKIADGLDVMADYASNYAGAQELTDWYYDTAGTWTDAFNNGDLSAIELTTEELTGAMAWADDLYTSTANEIVSDQIFDGTDITAQYIKNPDYWSDGGSLAGWTVMSGRNAYGRYNSTPAWFNNYHRVLEMWNSDFNIYQDITLPKTGAYRVSTHGFYRCSDNQTMGAANAAWTVWQNAGGENTGANEVRAFFYADQLQKAFPNICKYTYTREQIDAIGAAYDEETAMAKPSRRLQDSDTANMYPYDFLLVEGDAETGSFIPNGVYSADYIFNNQPYADEYKMEFVFVAQKDQPVRFGIKAENAGVPANDIGWTVFDQLQLIYVGADAEILAGPLAEYIAQAQKLVNNPMSAETKKVLNTVINRAQSSLNAMDGEAMLAAYTAFGNAIADANISIEAYNRLATANAALAEAVATYGAQASDAALAEANALIADVDAAIEEGYIANSDVDYRIDDINAAIENLQIPDFSKKAFPYDLTYAIQNPKFENGFEGWQQEGFSTSVAYNIAEGYNSSDGEMFNIYQTVTGLPAGTYEVHAQGIARLSNNDINVEFGFASRDQAVRDAAYESYASWMPYFYANGEQTWIANPYVLPNNYYEREIMATHSTGSWYTLTFDGGDGYDSIYDETTGELRNFYIPNDRMALASRLAEKRYNEDGEVDEELTKASPWYDNVVRCYVDESGELTFGWKTNNTFANTWAAMANFRLYYVSDDGNAPVNNDVKLAIHVENAGTLRDSIYAHTNSLDNVVEITVSGSVNENDLELFRSMSKLKVVDLSETDITRFNSDYFAYHYQLTKAVLPKNVEYISWGLFYNDYNLREIVCPTAVPPYLDSEIMGGNEYQCTLYVPSISQPFYQQANYWSWFNVVGVNMLPESFVVNHETYTLNLPDSIPAAYKPNVHIGTLGLNGSHYYGGLEVNGNATFSMNNFSITFDPNIDRQNNYGWYERSQHRSVTHGTLLNNANLRADNVSVTLWNKTNEWTFFSLPFDVNVGSISKEFDDTPFVIRKYDGAKRAAGEMNNTWVDMTEDSTLVAGQGYILQSPSTNNRNYDGFSFSALQTVNKNNIFANDNVDVQLAEYLSEFPQNRSWNLVGNPYPCFFDARAIDTSAPIIVWNAYNSNYEAYSPVDDQLILKPGEAFFIQRPVDQASITFVKEGRQLNLTQRGINYFAGARQSELTAQRSVFNLSITGEGELSDRTRFVINSDAKMSYETGTDASKFMSLKANAVQLYTVNSGVRYAINERPMESGIIELGLQVGTEGTYTVALDTEVQNEVFLIDRLNGTENRIDGTAGYEFFAEQGTIEGRFAIRLGDGELTGIHAVSTSDKTNGEYYDLRGVRTAQPRKGIYIQNGKKVVVK